MWDGLHIVDTDHFADHYEDFKISNVTYSAGHRLQVLIWC